MSTKRNTTAVYYVLAFVAVIVIFLLLGGGPWLKGMMHGSGSTGMAQLNWVQILVSLGLGFLLGIIVAGRKW